MFQRLKLLKDVLGLYLNRQKGMALIERVEASDLSDTDRACVSRIMRTMLGFLMSLGKSRLCLRHPLVGPDLSYRLKMLHFDIPLMPLLDYNDDGPHRPRAAF